ncbi:hypothetical protein PV08_07863 [Exophiala spinifera]|uniref:Uncharacterized protein n=1 Tax=Exophiala spinifera TaxID=91928 RepID=A0A0D1YJE7_9EURO|nr:uncharacterized protein PV08_07863 [Exophiala spinifera]KIW15076.1 hypothetical protein PV08_07863 [Exophiala spinifera]
MPSSQSSDQPLPAFGIRDLNGCGSPPGIVQILAKDYASTITTWPEAILTYVDDDDGEIIVVGSSFELTQRLEEPVRHSNLPAIPALRTPDEPADNKLMHIFDIKKSSASLSVWKDFEAYTSKVIREKTTPESLRSVSPSESAASPALPATQQKVQQSDKIEGSVGSASSLAGAAVTTQTVADNTTVSPIISSATVNKTTPGPSNNDGPTNLDKAFIGIFSAIESKLGPLADFLETTADGLRKVADKTARSDSSAVEDILGGFKDILTQVGEFGLGVAATIGEEIEKNKAKQHDASVQSDEGRAALPTGDDTGASAQPEQVKPSEKVDVLGKKVCFVPPPRSSATIPALSRMNAPNRQQMKQMIMDWRPSGARYGGFLQDDRVHTAQQPDKATVRHSIMDMESADPDFSTRYPPLLSLRKAKSVNGLQNPSQVAGSSQPNPVTGPASVRYPSLKQFEQQAHNIAFNKTSGSLAGTRPRNVASREDELLPKKTALHKKPSVEEGDGSDEPGASTVKPTPSSLRDTTPSGPLPGAWPETKPAEDMSALPTTRTIINGGSRRPPKPDLFAMPQTNPTGYPRPQLRPPPDFSPRPSMTWTALEEKLRRNHTVSGINPAARLNGPFDPLAHHSPTQPRPQQSQPDLKKSYRSSEHTLDHKPSLPSLLPQRSHTVNYTDRYVPRYVTPSVYLDRARDYAESRNNARDHRIDGNHMPGPSWGVRYFSPFGQPATTAASSARTPSATTGEGHSSSDVKAKLLSAARPALEPRPSIVPPVQRATTKPAERGISRSTPPITLPSSVKAVNECVKALIDMGFGANPDEMTRLNAVAGATAGNLEEAIDMLEEDREATEQLAYANDSATHGSAQDEREDMYS